jgi:hypothetical protein
MDVALPSILLVVLFALNVPVAFAIAISALSFFFLTDGQPTAGKETDPTAIREAVRRWNAGRGVRIHTVAVGDNFPLLQWISSDNGGEHRFIE